MQYSSSRIFPHINTDNFIYGCFCVTPFQCSFLILDVHWYLSFGNFGSSKSLFGVCSESLLFLLFQFPKKKNDWLEIAEWFKITGILLWWSSWWKIHLHGSATILPCILWYTIYYYETRAQYYSFIHFYNLIYLSMFLLVYICLLYL